MIIEKIESVRNEIKKAVTKKKVVEEVECVVSDAANIAESSEFKVFEIGAEAWNIPNTRVDDDFKDYINDGTIPFYARDGARRVIATS